MGELIKAPRGTQDVMPQESYKWLNVEEILRHVVHQFGYKEIRLPTFEHTELFQRGVGDTTDIVGKEMYTFLDKGERSITLRPEGTSNTIRAVLEHGALGGVMPLRAYYLQSCFRYEKPQAGRLREFHQIGIELIGAQSYDADLEVILTGQDIINAVGIKGTRLDINSIGCPKCRPAYHKALKEYFAENVDNLCPDCKVRLEKNPLRILDCKVDKCQKIAEYAPLMLDYLCEECSDHFDGLKRGLVAVGLDYTINPKIVRGLDYYTKTVFEFVHTGAGAQGTVCGGGRYDGLVEMLGGKPTPSVGFGLGIERLLMIMEAEGLSFGDAPVPKLFIACMGAQAHTKALQLTTALRRTGVYCEYDVMERSIKAQFKYADKIGAKYVLTLGDDEVASGNAKIKNMADGAESDIEVDEAALARFFS